MKAKHYHALRWFWTGLVMLLGFADVWAATFDWPATITNGPLTFTRRDGSGVTTTAVYGFNGTRDGSIPFRGSQFLLVNDPTGAVTGPLVNDAIDNDATVTLTAGNIYYIRAEMWDGAIHYGAITTLDTTEEGPPPTYGVTIPIPANNTDHAITYIVTNAAGESVGSFTQNPGAEAAELYLGGLETDGALNVLQVTGGFVGGTPPAGGGAGNIELVSSGNPYGHPPTTTVNVNAGIVPGAETSPGSGSSATAPATTPPQAASSGTGVPPTAAPSAPTPTTPTSAPVPTAPVDPSTPGAPSNPTPTGADGAKKEDVMANANQISDRIREASGKAVETGNAVVAATDKVATAVSDNGTKNIEATGKVATAVWESGKGTIEALNKANTSLSEINTRLAAQDTKLGNIATNTGGIATKIDATNSKLDTANTKLEAIKTAVENGPSRTADTAAATASYGAAQAAGGTAKTAAEGSISGGGPMIAPVQPSPPSSWEINVPGIATFDLDPAHDATLSTVISWCRALGAWVIALGFVWWMWGEFKEVMGTALLLPQAKGNTVAAGTGGQATSLLAAAAISVFLLGLPTAYFALTSYGSGIASNPFSGAPGPIARALYLVYLFLPVEAAVSAITAAFAVRKGALIILTGIAAAVRHVTP